MCPPHSTVVHYDKDPVLIVVCECPSKAKVNVGDGHVNFMVKLVSGAENLDLTTYPLLKHLRGRRSKGSYHDAPLKSLLWSNLFPIARVCSATSVPGSTAPQQCCRYHSLRECCGEGSEDSTHGMGHMGRRASWKGKVRPGNLEAATYSPCI